MAVIINGKYLNKKWKVDAKHSLYHRDGDWYNQLERFPGALFDPEGYILFETEEEYRECSYLQIKKQIHVPNGISTIPGYIPIIINGIECIPAVLSKTDGTASKVFFEGEAKKVELTRYERSSENRDQCIAYHGTSCCVCDFNFGKTYGVKAKNIIHVHHLTPVAELGKSSEVNPINDLRPVCPNCHAVIHMRRPPFSIEEVQRMLEEILKGNESF